MAKKNKNIIKGSQITVGGNFIVGDQVTGNSKPPLLKSSSEVIESTDIIKLIGKGKVDKAITALVDAASTKDQELFGLAIIQQEKWNHLKKQRIANTIESSKADLAHSKIINNIIKLCGELSLF
jgi:hypothetical protein